MFTISLSSKAIYLRSLIGFSPESSLSDIVYIGIGVGLFIAGYILLNFISEYGEVFSKEGKGK